MAMKMLADGGKDWVTNILLCKRSLLEKNSYAGLSVCEIGWQVPFLAGFRG